MAARPSDPARTAAVRAAAALAWFALLLAARPAGAQAVPRANLPPAGALRITFEPLITFWNEELYGETRRPLGAWLSGDSLGGAQLPQLARLNQDVAVASGAAGFVANLGTAVLALHADRRVTPLQLELGLANRVSLGVRVPLVRVHTRAGFALDSAAANLGRNPRSNVTAADSLYGAFFGEFDAALATMDQNIASGAYGAPGAPQRAAAQAFADSARAVRAALRRAAYGTGPGDAAPFLPTATSAGGAAIGTNVTRIQQTLVTTWGVPGFNDAFLLPAARASATDVQAMLLDPDAGWGAATLTGTRQARRHWLGDVELEARWAAVRGEGYAATVGALVRLPTGHQDSPHDFADLAAGDGQLDVEATLVQELRAGPLWLHAALRAGVQTAGQRERRVAPGAPLAAPRGATALLDWDPGDYVQVDVAPLLRLHRQFAAGLTLGWASRAADRYSYRSAGDSAAVAAVWGAPVAAAELNAQTGTRVLRLGGAASFTGPGVEGSFALERVVSGRGGPVPAQTLARIALRVTHRLF